MGLQLSSINVAWYGSPSWVAGTRHRSSLIDSSRINSAPMSGWVSFQLLNTICKSATVQLTPTKHVHDEIQRNRSGNCVLLLSTTSSTQCFKGSFKTASATSISHRSSVPDGGSDLQDKGDFEAICMRPPFDDAMMTWTCNEVCCFYRETNEDMQDGEGRQGFWAFNQKCWLQREIIF